MKTPRCLQCAARVDFKADVGQWLRFQVLCVTCTGRGYRLELHTSDPLPPRTWRVGARTGAGWSK